MPFQQGLENILCSDSIQWVAFTAKGGQGKTTCACAAAVQVALRRPTARVLVISTDPAHNVSDAFAQRFSRDPQVVRGFDNLYAVEIDPERDFANTDLGRALLPPTGDRAPGGDGAADSALDAEDPLGLAGIVSELITTVPGIDEALSFGQMMKSVQEMDYDLIVFDMAPTGHALKLLSFPSVLERGLRRLLDLRTRMAPMLNMASSMMGMSLEGGASAFDAEIVGKMEELLGIVRRVDEQFRDARRTAFVCVCMPEFLSVYETERLLRELKRLHMHCGNLLINQVLWVNDAASAASPRDSLYVPVALSGERVGYAATELYESRVQIQQKYLQQIEDLYGEDFHITRMPMWMNEVRGVADLRAFGEALMQDSGIRPPEPLESATAESSLRNVVAQRSLELIIASGKGNVGKTTTTAALAVHLAEESPRGRRVLLVSTDPAHSLSDAFGQNFSRVLTREHLHSSDAVDEAMRPVRAEGIRGRGQLDVLEIDTADFLRDLHQAVPPAGESAAANDGAESDPRTAMAAAMLGAAPSEVIRDLLQAVPGIDDAIAFTRLMQRIQALDYDVVVLDTAPTGHTLRLLSFPSLLQRGLDKLEEVRQRFSGPLSMAASLAGNMGMPGAADGARPDQELAERLRTMQQTILQVVKQFQDAERTTFICVCIAEFLSVYETERLVQDLAEYGIDTHNVVVNQLFAAQASEAERVAMVQSRVAMQQRYLHQIDELYARDLRLCVLPLETQEVRGVEALRHFGQRILP
ncbi:hypothetical protein CDCA_CDCA11G3136 [Cyanidium caldarium]|uniref:ArsA/GET3 Anion-transporting ATPase-like domain-containing protein n=1 Tax=Cyanidium caldarium TaxID=2771 RepID=A0AAV9IY92_CYACA|nr:hypothetical protein CDCA_CDCA11G3136 [Cyanidium caldarium]